MKKILLFILFISNLYSETDWKLNLVNMHIDYREYSFSNELIDSEKSKSLIGLEGIFTDTYLDGTYFRYNLSFLNGNTKYIGSYLNDPNSEYGSLISTTFNYFIDESIEYGVKFSLNKDFNLFTGVKIGGHLWIRGLSKNQIEYYYWMYIEPLLELEYMLNKNINIGLKLIKPQNIFTKMYADNLNTTFTLGGVNTYGFAIPIKIKIDNNNYNFEIKYEKQEIIESNIVGGYYEPKSTSEQVYIKLNIIF